MTDPFRNDFTRKTLKIMLGNMYPSEMADLVQDPQIRRTDIPDWIEQTLRRECTYVVQRMPRYQRKMTEILGYEPGCVVRKLSVYYMVRDNWDDLEPCNFEFMKPIRCYFDCQIPQAIKDRIDSAVRPY